MDQQAKTFQNSRKATRYIRKDIKISFVKSYFVGLKETIKCELLDISSTGMQIATANKIKLNSSLHLTLLFDTGDEFNLDAKAIWNKKNSSFKSEHIFPTIKNILDDKKTSLKTLSLYEADTPVPAKFRNLTTTHVETLTDSPLHLSTEYNLLFTLSDKNIYIIDSKITSCKQLQQNCYGLRFKKPNDQLGDCLLDTQTHLIFK